MTQNKEEVLKAVDELNGMAQKYVDEYFGVGNFTWKQMCNELHRLRWIIRTAIEEKAQNVDVEELKISVLSEVIYDERDMQWLDTKAHYIVSGVVDYLHQRGLIKGNEWRPVFGYEEYYEVNKYGTVRKKQCKTPLKQWSKSGTKYKLVRLSSPRKVENVHRIVAHAFVPNPQNKPFVNHIDNDPANNWAKNLEWCTQQENLDHARKQGRMYSHPKGEPSPNRRLSDEQVEKIKALAFHGRTQQKIADAVGCSKRTVGRILNGQSYCKPAAPKKDAPTTKGD